MFRVEAIWTAALIALGSIGSLVYNWPTDPQDDSDSTQVESALTTSNSRGFTLTLDNPNGDGIEGDSVVDPSDELSQGSDELEQGMYPAAPTAEFNAVREGDRLLLGGSFLAAYESYAKISRRAVDSSDAVLLVRLGLSSELGGFFDQALSHYQQAIKSPNTSPLQRIWSMLGTARVWRAQGRLDEASALLSELFLLYGTDDYPIEVREPIAELLVDSLERANRLRSPADAMIHQLIGPATMLDMESILSSELRIDVPPRTAADDSGLKIIQNPLNDLSLVIVDVQLSLVPMQELLSRLSKELGQEIRISSRARSSLAGRSIQIDTTSLPLSVLLDQMLGPLGLAWQVQAGNVEVKLTSELNFEQQRSFENKRMQRLLRQLQLAARSSEKRCAALMREGNSYLVERSFTEASGKFRSARDLQPNSELSAALYYNNAICEVQQAKYETALDQFYRALDQSMAIDLQALSYGHIAELELNLGRPDRAIPAASRGLKLSGVSELAGRNLMILAKSYLLDADPFSANRVLFEYSGSVIDQRHARLATLLSSYARFRAIQPATGLQNEGERLVLALAAIRDEDLTGFIDHLVTARAYYDVGFRTKATEHLRVAAERVDSEYWEGRIQFELAGVMYLAGDLTGAEQVLANFATEEGEPIYFEAQMLRAKIGLKLGREQECISACYLLLPMAETEDAKAETLQLLGNAFQQVGQHYAAALCFAGLLPDEQMTAASNPAASPETARIQ